MTWLPSRQERGCAICSITRTPLDSSRSESRFYEHGQLTTRQTVPLTSGSMCGRVSKQWQHVLSGWWWHVVALLMQATTRCNTLLGGKLLHKLWLCSTVTVRGVLSAQAASTCRAACCSGPPEAGHSAVHTRRQPQPPHALPKPSSKSSTLHAMCPHHLHMPALPVRELSPAGALGR